METVTTFWVRTDVFQHGLIPLRPDSGLSWASLKQLVNKYQVAREMSREYFRKINYDMPTVEATLNFPEWKTVALEDLRFSEAQLELYWERFRCIKQARDKRWRRTGWVLFYEFVMFLAVQLIGRMPVSKKELIGEGDEISPEVVAKYPVVDMAETQIKFVAENLYSLLSLACPVPHEGITRSQSDKGDVIDPEQLAYLGFIIGGSQASERLDLEAENWFAIMPVGKTKGKYKISEIVGAIRTNLTVNGHHYHIASQKAPINLAIPSLVKNRPRARSRGGSLSSTYTAVTRPLSRPLVIKQVTGEVIVKADPSFIPNSMLSNAESDEEEMYATINGPYLSEPATNSPATSKKPRGTGMTTTMITTMTTTMTATMTTTMTTTTSPTSSPVHSATSSSSTTTTTTTTTTTPTTGAATTATNAHPTLDDSNGSFKGASKTGSELDSEEIEYSGQDSLEEVQGECSEVLVGDAHIVQVVDSSIYLLFPAGNVYVKGCRRATIVLGAVAGNLTLEYCENCTVIAATHCLQIISCRKMQLQLLVNSQPILLGDNEAIVFGPYNTHYGALEAHLELADINIKANFFNNPLVYSQHMLFHKPLLFEEYKRAGLGGIGGVGDIDACIMSIFAKGCGIPPKKAESRERPKSISWRDRRNSLSGLDPLTLGSSPQKALPTDALLESSTVAKGGTGVDELYHLYDMDGEDFRFNTTFSDILAPINKQEEKKREIQFEKKAKLEVLHQEFDPRRIYSIQSPKDYLPFSIPVFLQGQTTKNPVPLYPPYQAALDEKVANFSALTEQLDYLNEAQKAKVKEVLAAGFKEWLKTCGNAAEIDRLVKVQLNSIRRARSQRK